MAKYEYKPLKDIDVKIQRVLEKLGIDPQHSVEKAIAGRQNFYIFHQEHGDKHIIFKARIADHRVLQQWGKNFQNERRFLRTLQKNDPHHPIHEHLPVYLNSQSKEVEWIMYQFIDQEPAGSSNINYNKPNKKDILKIVALLQDMQAFPIQEFCQTHPWTKKINKMDFERYHAFFHKMLRRRKEITNILGKDLIDQADKILIANKRTLDNSCSIFSHGDLHPANIIIGQQAIAIDWEELHIDNVSSDIVDLWFRMINHRRLRRFLLLEFAKVTKQSKIFPQLFQLNLLARLPEEIGMWSDLLKKPIIASPNEKELKKYLDICYSNFVSALKGEALQDYE